MSHHDCLLLRKIGLKALKAERRPSTVRGILARAIRHSGRITSMSTTCPITEDLKALCSEWQVAYGVRVRTWTNSYGVSGEVKDTVLTGPRGNVMEVLNALGDLD